MLLSARRVGQAGRVYGLDASPEMISLARANAAAAAAGNVEAAGMALRLQTTARRVDVSGRKLLVTRADGAEDVLAWDQLVIGTGAIPARPVAGLDILGPADGVHLLHSMDDTFAVMRTLEEASPESAVIVGAGYIGLEMAEA